MGGGSSRQIEVISVGPIEHKSAASAPAASVTMGPTPGVPKGSPVTMEGYGDHCFVGVTAEKYLAKNGGSGSWLESAA